MTEKKEASSCGLTPILGKAIYKPQKLKQPVSKLLFIAKGKAVYEPQKLKKFLDKKHHDKIDFLDECLKETVYPGAILNEESVGMALNGLYHTGLLRAEIDTLNKDEIGWKDFDEIYYMMSEIHHVFMLKIGGDFTTLCSPEKEE